MGQESASLTVIPAKRHSTRLPGKNVKRLHGRTLLEHAIAHAVASGVCGTIAVSTDDEEIAAMARAAGAEAPFLRDPAYSGDEVSVGRAAAEMLRRYRTELGRTFDDFCLLLTTCPLRTAEDIVACRRIYDEHPEVDAVMSVTHYEYPPLWANTLDADGYITPMFPEPAETHWSKLPECVLCNGAVYWARAGFYEGVDGDQYVGKTLPYFMPRERSVDIDTEADWALAELLMAHRQGQGDGA